MYNVINEKKFCGYGDFLCRWILFVRFLYFNILELAEHWMMPVSPSCSRRDVECAFFKSITVKCIINYNILNIHFTEMYFC